MMQKGALCVSLRRLGDELYRPAAHIHGDGGLQDAAKHCDYIQSHDLQIRFVSALIILKTDAQGKVEILSILIPPLGVTRPISFIFPAKADINV